MESNIENRIARYMQRLIAQQMRDDEIRQLRQAGWTLEKIGKKFGLTRSRIQQIVGKKGEEE